MGATLWRQVQEPAANYKGNDWDLLNTSTVIKWNDYEAAHWGFDDRITYVDYGTVRLNPAVLTGRNLQAFIQKWPTEFPEFLEFAGMKDPTEREEVRTLLLLERYDGQDGHIYYTVMTPEFYFYPRQGYVVENRRQDKYLKTLNLIGFQFDHAIIQVIHASNRVDILVLENYQIQGFDFRVKCVYNMDIPVSNCLLEAYISPDLGKLILKPSHNYSVLAGKMPPTHNIIQLIDITEDTGTLLTVLFEDQAAGLVIAFDPRFYWRRVVMGTSDPAVSDTNIKLYDLVSESALSESGQTQEFTDMEISQMTQNLVYSSDGVYIASLAIQRGPPSGDFLRLQGVILYDSDTLAIIRYIESCSSTNPAICHVVPTAIFPQFSANARHLAVPVVDPQDNKPLIQVYHVPQSIRLNLQQLCRIAIMSAIPKEQFRYLPLPKRLIEFLLLKPYLH